MVSTTLPILATGVKAPSFQFTNKKGNTVDTRELVGKRWVLYFYPKDDTPGCTKEACAFRNAWSELSEKEIIVLGCSPDSDDSHVKFANKYQIPFDLVADPDKNIAKNYGVWGEKQFMGKRFEGVHRITYLIGSDGNIAYTFNKVKPDTHASDILKLSEEIEWK